MDVLFEIINDLGGVSEYVIGGGGALTLIVGYLKFVKKVKSDISISIIDNWTEYQKNTTSMLEQKDSKIQELNIKIIQLERKIIELEKLVREP